MRQVKNIFLIFGFCLTPIFIFSQSTKSSLSFSNVNYRADVLKTSFEKILNTYNLRTELNYSANVNDLFIGVNENYFSSVIKSSENNIKDEQFLSITGEYKIAPILSLGLLTKNSIYSNDRKIAINEASILHSTIYGKIVPLNQLTIVPFGGVSINKQVGEDDRGSIYGTDIQLDRLPLNEFQISSNLIFQNEDIAPRKNTHQLASISIKNNFDLSLTNILSADYSDTRKDFYFETDSITANLFNITKNIQSRTEKKYFIEERFFNSRYSSDIFFDLTGRISMRNIDRETRYKNLDNLTLSSFDTEIEEFRVDLSGTTEYRSKLFFGKIKIDYSEREEKHKVKKIDEANEILSEQRDELERKKNNTSDYTTVSAVGNLAVTDNDNIGISLLHRKLIYNTSSAENFDDRDELLSIVRLSYLKRFNHLFDFFVNLEGSFNHLVYVFAERSSNNNIRRILKLSSGGVFDASKIYSRNTIEVSANYTSYDFADINPNIRSFSFRQFSAKDSTSLRFYNNIHFNFSGYVKLSEQGDFVWSNFSNSPDRFLTEFYLEPTFNIKSNNSDIGVGLRVFNLQTFGYNANGYKFLSTKYSSIGPTTTFSLRMPNLILFLHGWYEFINSENDVTRELANLSFSINWKL